MAEMTKDDLPKVRAVLKGFNAARKRLQIFAPTHPFVGQAIEELRGILEAAIEGRGSFTLSIVEGELYAEGLLMAEESLTFEDLIRDLAARGLSNLTFTAGLTVEELSAFIPLSVAKQHEIDEQGGIQAVLQKHQVRHVVPDQLTVASPGAGLGPARPAGSGTGGGGDGGARVSREVYRAAIQSMIETFGTVKTDDKVNVGMVEGVVQVLMSSVVAKQDLSLGVSALKDYNEYTFFHSVNVAVLSLLMGAKLGLDDTMLRRLGVAALLHDIGKTRIPEEIVTKTDKLTDAEFEIMKAHPVEGAKILAGQSEVDELAVLIAAQHHAHYDLSGYPKFSKIGDLHFLSHVVTVADVYDALTSDRSYRQTMLPDRAMRIIIEGKGKSFHPLLVKLFVQLTGMFPVGTAVLLDSGQVAVVTKANSTDIFRPKVRLAVQTDGGFVAGMPVDLSEKNTDDAYAKTIIRSLDPQEYGIDTGLFSQ